MEVRIFYDIMIDIDEKWDENIKMNSQSHLKEEKRKKHVKGAVNDSMDIKASSWQV